MPYSFTLTTTIPASAQEIYDAWLDSLAHSEMTGGKATMSNEAGAEVYAWDGYITGRNLELVPGERIVQSWRTTQFADEHDDSVVTVIFEDVENGALLTLVHSNVPDEQTSYELGGWEQHYFGPMKKYFVDRTQPEADRTSEPAALRKRSKRAAAPPKLKRVKPKSKKQVSKGRSQRSVAARAKPRRVKNAKGKPVRPKRRR